MLVCAFQQIAVLVNGTCALYVFILPLD